jgi:hypothetical protein
MKILSFDVGIINLAYCILENNKILHWEIISLQQHKDHNNLYIELITNLDARKHLLEDIQTVLIEKQPSFNPKMRIIAGCLQTYFVIRGMVDKSVIKKVLFYSPKHKLKCYTGETLEVKGSTKYARTKKMGVLITYKKLEEYNERPEIHSLFKNSKKKDDLADCYLQALSYTNQHQLPSEISGHNETKITKIMLKRKFKDYLDTIIPKSVIELMNKPSINDITGFELYHELVDKYTIDSPHMVFEKLQLKSYLKNFVV